MGQLLSTPNFPDVPEVDLFRCYFSSPEPLEGIDVPVPHLSLGITSLLYTIQFIDNKNNVLDEVTIQCRYSNRPGVKITMGKHALSNMHTEAEAFSLLPYKKIGFPTHSFIFHDSVIIRFSSISSNKFMIMAIEGGYHNTDSYMKSHILGVIEFKKTTDKVRVDHIIRCNFRGKESNRDELPHTKITLHAPMARMGMDRMKLSHFAHRSGEKKGNKYLINNTMIIDVPNDDIDGEVHSWLPHPKYRLHYYRKDEYPVVKYYFDGLERVY